MHPQTLRTYDRMGLVSPRRTAKRGRRYSARDIARLRLMQRLSQDEGINLEGIRRILAMQDEIDELRSRLRASWHLCWPPCRPRARGGECSPPTRSAGCTSAVAARAHHSLCPGARCPDGVAPRLSGPPVASGSAFWSARRFRSVRCSDDVQHFQEILDAEWRGEQFSYSFQAVNPVLVGSGRSQVMLHGSLPEVPELGDHHGERLESADSSRPSRIHIASIQLGNPERIADTEVNEHHGYLLRWVGETAVSPNR